MNKNKLIRNIQKLQFAAVELNLYLDNFPGNDAAEKKYKQVSCKLDELIYEYETKYGPLRNFGAAYTEDTCSWTNDPWPWEN